MVSNFFVDCFASLANRRFDGVNDAKRESVDCFVVPPRNDAKRERGLGFADVHEAVAAVEFEAEDAFALRVGSIFYSPALRDGRTFYFPALRAPPQ